MRGETCGRAGGTVGDRPQRRWQPGAPRADGVGGSRRGMIFDISN
jgi:hypothetical protein